MPHTRATIRLLRHGIILLLIAGQVAICHSQEINSAYADMTIPGQWQPSKQFVTTRSGTDLYYDASSGAVLEITQQPGMAKVSEIAKFFASSNATSKDAAGLMSAAAFPLPFSYTERASKDLAKGNKPPKIWDLKDGEGDPMWFYASQLFDAYQMHDSGGSSEVREEYQPVHVTTAAQRSISGGDALVFEVESDRPATEAALKRFHMPPVFKDQHVRFGWVQFAPGGIAAGQGVLSVAFATAANSKLNVDEVLKQVSVAKIKPL